MKKQYLSNVNTVIIYIGVIVLSIIVQFWVMQLWRADLWVPFSYFGDCLFSSTWIKGIIDNGWYLQNNYIGAPFGQTLYDFPLSNNLDFVIMKFISLFVPNYAFVMNAFFLLTFSLTTLTSMLVLRQLKLSYATSALGSLLYAFLPYHFWRGEGHLFLAAYYMIPLICLVTIWVFQNKLTLQFSNQKLVASIIICVLIGSSYIYYPFFSCFFLIIAGITSAMYYRNRIPLIISILLVSIVMIAVFINVSPTIIYHIENGNNPQVAARLPQESEIFGLKIIQLLLPIDIHRVPFMAAVTMRYFSTAPLPNEGTALSLGIVIGFGFLILIGWIFYRGSEDRLNALSLLNLSGLLLGGIGGFGTIIAYLGFPEIRCYDRISIFIAFFSMAALMVILDISREKYKNKRFFFNIFLVILLIGGILDQTGSSYPYRSFSTNYEQTKEIFLKDQDFINKIETIMPVDTKILQLPYLSFPESGSVNGMADYSPFRAYLHSKTLHWSYGAMKGRSGDEWLKGIVSEPLPKMVRDINGTFGGIYIDRSGYVDNGLNITSELSNILGSTPIESSDRKFVFFELREKSKK